MYVLPDSHGAGISAALMAERSTAAEIDANCVWLGVNQKNQRAQRFYTKHGFTINGTKTFRLGSRYRERLRDGAASSVGLASVRDPRWSAPAAATWPAGTSSGTRPPASPR